VPFIPTPRGELVAAGADPVRLDGDLRTGRVVAPFRGVYVDACLSGSFLVRVRAAIATQATSACVAMQTAAVLHRLRWLPAAWSAADATVHVAVHPDDERGHRRGIRLHRRTVRPRDVALVDGIACLSVARTLVELARDASVPPLLVVQILDGALRDERTTKQELRSCLAQFPGERGVARARSLVERARPGVDSPQETKMRLQLEDGGIAGLEVNIQVRDNDGLLLARGDLGITTLLIWGEYDGFVPHTDRAVFRSDRAGDRWLHRRGWHVMRFTDRDLDRPGATSREWRAAIADAPARIRALDPGRSPEVAAARRARGFD
jgi:hypothetical protein